MVPVIPLGLVGLGYTLGNSRKEREKANAKRAAAQDKREFRQRMALMDARAELAKQGIDPSSVDPGAAAGAVAEETYRRMSEDGTLNEQNGSMLSTIMSGVSNALNTADAAGVDTALRALAAFAGIPVPPELDGLSSIQTAAAAQEQGIQVAQVAQAEQDPPSVWPIVAAIGLSALTGIIVGAVVSR